MGFEKLRVYQAAEKLAAGIAILCRGISRDFADDVRQLRRAVASICDNIAEAYGVETPGRKVYHLRMARGSADEVRSNLRRLARDGATTIAAALPLIRLASTIAKMLTALIDKIEDEAK